jgi:chloride channel protein, CIC family
VLGAGDLAEWLNRAADEDVHLLRIPGNRLNSVDVDDRATIEEAQLRLREHKAEALCVRRASAPMIATVRGVVVQDDIDNYRETAP